MRDLACGIEETKSKMSATEALWHPKQWTELDKPFSSFLNRSALGNNSLSPNLSPFSSQDDECQSLSGNSCQDSEDHREEAESLRDEYGFRMDEPPIINRMVVGVIHTRKDYASDASTMMTNGSFSSMETQDMAPNLISDSKPRDGSSGNNGATLDHLIIIRSQMSTVEEDSEEESDAPSQLTASSPSCSFASTSSLNGPLQVSELELIDDIQLKPSDESKKATTTPLKQHREASGISVTLNCDDEDDVGGDHVDHADDEDDRENVEKHMAGGEDEKKEIELLEMTFSGPTHETKTPETETSASRVSRLLHIPFVHGSFSATAPMMLQDRLWKRILRKCMPGAYFDAVEMLRRNRSCPIWVRNAKIMKWGENNPVVAAYGMSQSATSSNGSDFDNGSPIFPTLEWDVFLDPTLVRQVEAALDKAETENQNSDGEVRSAKTVEVDRLVARLSNRLMLARGTAGQLTTEALGIPKAEYTFAKIVEHAEDRRVGRHVAQVSGDAAYYVTCGQQAVDETFEDWKSLSTGIFVTHWLRVFAHALRLGRMDVSELLHPTEAVLETYENVREIDDKVPAKPSFCGILLCLGYNDPNSNLSTHKGFRESATSISKLLGAKLRVVLNLKSRRVPPRVWARLLDTLQSRGVDIEGVASFDASEIREIATLCATPIAQLHLFHSAGDLQKACHANQIRRGDTVFLNAASLLANHRDAVGSEDFCNAFHDCGSDEEPKGPSIHPFAFKSREVKDRYHGLHYERSTLQDYQRNFRLHIGVYVNEFCVSDLIADRLIQFVNKNSEIYGLGMAWGGINGLAASGMIGDGYGNQRYLGRSWDASVDSSSEVDLHLFEERLNKMVAPSSWANLATVNMAVEK